MGLYTNQVKDTQQTQENLNPQNAVFPILKRHTETLLIEEGPTVIFENDISTYAIWGNAQSTWEGLDNNDKWGTYTDTTRVIVQVSNAFNKFIERFAFDTLEGSLNTSTWDTVNKQVTFSPGLILHIEPAFLDSTASETVTAATLNVTGTGIQTLELSADGGSNFETVTNNTRHIFTNTGNELQIKITGVGTFTWPITFPLTWATTGGTVTIITCEYEIST